MSRARDIRCLEVKRCATNETNESLETPSVAETLESRLRQHATGDSWHCCLCRASGSLCYRRCNSSFMSRMFSRGSSSLCTVSTQPVQTAPNSKTPNRETSWGPFCCPECSTTLGAGGDGRSQRNQDSVTPALSGTVITLALSDIRIRTLM